MSNTICTYQQGLHTGALFMGTCQHYLHGWLSTFSFGIQRVGRFWRAYDIDWRAEYGVCNWHDERFTNEADALAHIAAMSDYALTH